MPSVTSLDLTDARACAEWDDYVQTRAGGTAFHRTAWGLAIRDAFGHAPHYLMARDGSGIVGILPLILVKSLLFGKSLSSCAFAVYGGPVADSADAHAALDAAAWALAQTNGIGVLEYRNQERMRPEWVVKDQTYATFKRSLVASSDDNMKAIPRKQRAEVRKSLEKGLDVAIDRDARRHFAVYAESVRNLGTPVFPEKLFAALLYHYGDDADVLTVLKDGDPVSSVLSLYHKGEVLPYYGGGTPAARDLRGNDHMYWMLMEHAVKRGCTSFDFGRSKFGTGAFSFKKNWGFEPTPLLYEYRLAEGQAMPDVNPNNPKFAAMVAVWKRLPLPLANMLGPMVSRSLS
jgi:FemAB-related protein (PEP-CTERM system-associated)